MMALYRCDECGAEFDEPIERTYKEDMNGDGWAWQTFTELYCPECGSEELREC